MAKKIYWLVPTFHQGIENKILCLKQKGFSVEVFSQLERLLEKIKLIRSSIILLSDNTQDSVVSTAIKALANLQELGGARFILVTEKFQAAILRDAANYGFRDIIPLELSDQDWMQRFLYATSGKQATFQAPSGQVAMNERCEIRVPARVTWINEYELRLESRLTPNTHSQVFFEGPLAKALGEERLQITTQSVDSRKLVYRFSHGINAFYAGTNKSSVNAKKNLLSELKLNASKPRVRAFVAISHAKMRSDLLYNLDINQFDVSVALLKHSLRYDPQFFSPHIVFIEDKVLNSSKEDFEALYSIIGRYVPVVFVGPDTDMDYLARNFPDSNFFFENEIKNLQAVSIIELFLNTGEEYTQVSGPQKYPILPDHVLSAGQLVFRAKIASLHPNYISIKSPIKIDPYSLCELGKNDALNFPGQSIIFKVTNVMHGAGPDASFFYSGYFNSLRQSDKFSIGNKILDLANQFISDALNDGQSTEIYRDISQRNLQIPQQKNVSYKATEEDISSQDDIKVNEFEQVEEFKIKKIKDNRKTVSKNEKIDWLQVVRFSLIGAIVAGLFIGMVWGITSAIEPMYEKSGKQYSDSIRRLNGKIGH
ncbi:MAG: hypothetical protein KBD78_15075 [Oligoflexales bacterium]|nr:hypothetical protein [Oligoflexales bacterium]